VLRRHPRRHTTVRLLMLAAVASTAMMVGGAPAASAAPSPQQIEQQIDKAWNDLEPVIEQYNRIHSQLQTSRTQARKLSARLAPLQSQVDAATSSVGVLASRAYMQGGPSAIGAMLITGSPTGLTDKLTYLDLMARRQRAQVSGVIDLRDRYAADKRDLDAITASLAARDADLAAKKRQIEQRITELQKLRIRAYGPGGGARGALRTGPCPAEYTNDPGGRAAAKACSLIGKPYIWGAAGPNGYDCSGLTLVAWASAGVALRHYTKWQWADGTPVSRAQLKPGDLVFYYADLHHMGIYVGGNTIVHAPHTGDYVRMAPLDRMPATGYRRPG
jgi:peptidoglycan DL-endopeptidase CwlO